MPKLVDHAARREELAEAVWRVIRRDGIHRASVRGVAQEAGWSPGALRHYFASQAELLAFAMQLVTDRVTRRIASLPPEEDDRTAAARLLHELLPLDDERQAENEVFFAFAGRALIDPALRAQQRAMHDGLLRACRAALERLLGDGADAIDSDLEAERLHALVDGLAFHAAVRRERLSPERIAALLDRHLDTLEQAAGGRRRAG